MVKIDDSFKESLINEYLKEPISFKDIAERFGCHYVTISKILKEANIPKYTKQQLFCIGLDEYYFENIDCEEKAYFLGLFLADGCVFEGNSGEPKVLLGLSEPDVYMVEKFHTAINSPNKLRIDCRRNNKYVASVNTSRIMVEDLMALGVYRYKPNRVLPNIRTDLTHHMIRGFFDGDGSFGYRLSHPERKICNSYSGRVNMVAHEHVLPHLAKLLERDVCIYGYKISRVNSIMFLQCVDIRRKDDILKFYNYIYKDASIYLIRKKNRFKEYFKLNNMVDFDGTEIT